LARDHGIVDVDARDDQSLLDQWHEGERRGVRGLPHFFSGDDLDVFCPSLDIAKEAEGHLHLRRNVERLDAFLGACLG